MDENIEMEINLNDLDYDSFEELKQKFKDREMVITIKESKRLAPKEALKRMRDLQKKYPHKVISKSIDLSALANEVNL